MRRVLDRLRAVLGASASDVPPGARAELERLRASESRLRAALQSGRTVAWEWDLRTDTVVRSDNAPVLLGLPAENPARQGDTFTSYIHPDDRERARAAIARARATMTPVAVEFRLVRPDGSVIWVLDDGEFELDGTGRPIRMRGILRDVTEQKAAEERLAFVTDHAPVLIAQIDDRERYVFVNRPYAARYGARPDELIGRGVREVVGEAGYTQLGPHLRAGLSGEGEQGWESTEGDQHFEFRAARDHDERGAVRGLLVVISDITERKRAELELERAHREAEAANRAKDEFLATLSHELRTPLNAILGWARMLEAGKLDEDTTRRALDAIHRNTVAQTQLVEDLLDVARIAAGKLRLDVRPLDLADVIERALDSVRPATEAREIRLQRVLDPRIGPVMGDPDRLQQVMWNLLANAVKFTPRGGRVQVFLARVNSHLEIRVSDTGVGIPPALLPYVFERFVQGDSRAAGSHRGLGLGLALVKHLVEQHGGTVRAESPGPGQGTTFVVTLPLMIHPGQPAPDRIHPTAPTFARLDRSAAAALPGLKVVVVDDEPDTAELVARILEAAGAEVRACASAAEALAALTTWSPDVLVSDVEMPGEDGYGLIRRFRALEPAGRRLPAVAVTAYARSEDRIRALASGFTTHIPKPVEPVELVTVVSALAGRIRYASRTDEAPRRDAADGT
jgi:PAS domain S-box-containing protein